MKTTLSWIKDHLETGASLETLCQTLTNLGLVVDRVEDPGPTLGIFRVAEIVEAVPHPQADRLQVCRVSTGEGEIQVVCGAANARVGLKTVLALPGDVIPATGQPLKKGTIRGVESHGMLCSYTELNLVAIDFGGNDTGIIEVAQDVPVGCSFAAHLGLTDPILDIEITPNRGDAFGVRGLARDLAAAGQGVLKEAPQPFSLMGESQAPSGALPPGGTLLFATCAIHGVRNGPSPVWVQQRLKAIGLKPVSALVDVTNYLTFDLGRPLHVFDLDKIQGSLRLRLSQGGESFAALDGKTYTLPEGLLVITDESGIISLAGIIGGASTACTEHTTHVLLESAFFSPDLIRKGGQETGIISDARIRFERGVDPAMVLSGLEAALHLITSWCGGAVGERQCTGKAPVPHSPLFLSLKAIETRGGLKVPLSQALTIFEKLGFAPVVKEDGIEVTPPSWRFDMAAEEDLIEEILRVVGYEKIPPVFLPFRPVLSALTRPQHRPFKLKRCLASRGFFEVVTWSFLSPEKARRFGGGAEALTLLNPISADLAVMRPTLLPHLLDLARYHAHRSLPFHPVFEVGPQYAGINPEEQQAMLTALIPLEGPLHWQKLPPVDLFSAKSHLHAVLEVCGIAGESLQWDTEHPSAWYHPGRSGRVKQGRSILANFGEIHPGLLRDFSLEGRFCAFEIFLDHLAAPKPSFPRQSLALSPYQSVARDLCFVVDQTISCAKLTQVVRKAAGKHLTSLRVFDVFEDSARLGPDKKSLTLRLILQALDGTLTEEHVAPLIHQVIQEAARLTGAVLRG